MGRRLGVFVSIVMFSAGGCGGGGGDGGTGGTLKKTFSFPHVLETSGRITQLSVGDLDGDGVADLVVLDASTSSVTTLDSTGLRESPTLQSLNPKKLARGLDAFELGVAHAFVWDTTADLGTADMNRDGRPDLIVAGGSSGQVGVWLSERTPSGTERYHEWRWPVIVDVGGSCDRVAAGDVNGDGRADLVTLDESTGQVHLLLANPPPPAGPPDTVTFTVDASPPTIGACFGLVVTDVDRDGDLDILTNRPDADAVAMLLAGGAAGFMLRESPTRASTGRSMAVGDVDGDDWLDIVLLAEGGESAVCLHQRSAEPGVFDTVESPLGLAVREDALPVALLSIDEPGTARAGDARGDGCPEERIAFAQAGQCGTPASRRCQCPLGLALADLDRDGALDIICSPVVGDPDTDPLVAFAIRESPTRHSPAERLAPKVRESPTLASTGRVCAVADLDNDGHLDVVTGDPDFDLLRIHYVEDAAFVHPPNHSPSASIQSGHEVTACRMADMDRDGHPDIVCSTSSGIEVHWQDAAAPGSFLPPTVLAPAQPFVDVAVGDVNGDGCPDMVLALPGGCVVLPRDPLVARGFAPPIPFPPATPAGGLFRAVALGDVDGDGHLDCVALRESPSKASLGRSLSNGFFDVFTEIDVAVTDPRGLCVADLDGDGRLDLAVCGGSECAIVLHDPAPGLMFQAPQPQPLMGGVSVAAGDVNGDGRCDLIVGGDRNVSVSLQSQLDGAVFQPAHALSREICGGLAVCDLDRDGALDVAFVEAALGTVVGTGGDPDFDLLRVIGLNGLPPGVPWGKIYVAAGDVNGDGRADLVIAHPAAPGALSSTIQVFMDSP